MNIKKLIKFLKKKGGNFTYLPSKQEKPKTCLYIYYGTGQASNKVISPSSLICAIKVELSSKILKAIL